ncbi:hypothetical protein HM1_2906 [Heliomicrobium modesticaldum Ice1]|uniref:Uncharacterized protein n=1 Tax=Heliobacterium modesticaldum (strain ATCC 51547 / Ice1) TaxID=498761 RepID=B0TCW4_HELMI|nr:hypothetical protein HM1_2906 [Heliomicrobium modesticaldum Ice1]
MQEISMIHDVRKAYNKTSPGKLLGDVSNIKPKDCFIF